MNRARLVAALTGMITALLLQAALVAPVTAPWPVSLPVVLVAAVGLVDGPATGMSFGFAAGLLADLGSNHPAGVLALCWLGVGLLCGMVADRRSLRRDALTAGLVCTVGTSVATVVLAVTHSGSSAVDAIRYLVVTAIGDGLLAFGVLALVRRMLRTDSLRAPHPVYTEVVVAGGGRG
jgi:cell shape-determining protein MreD